MKRHHAHIFTSAGMISAAFSIIGALHLCCIALPIAIMGIFGGFFSILSAYNAAFIILALAFFSAAALLYRKTPKRCK